jgi:hypothetical protein
MAKGVFSGGLPAAMVRLEICRSAPAVVMCQTLLTPFNFLVGIKKRILASMTLAGWKFVFMQGASS